MFWATHRPSSGGLKLHWQPLVFHTWKVVGRVVVGCCQAQYVPDNVHQLHVQHNLLYQTSVNLHILTRLSARKHFIG